ncbi:unnamed protein product [Thelazia callipaeda]|uniref:Innexin n=1 Tax=Thelazia callipaeda TaxID=103827 RepID=A0A0N5CJV4_THECL|nr:unnamed protein product [Thelazia callipaeda]
MLTWTELFASKFVPVHSDLTDNFVDRLNYLYTVALFMFMAAVTGAKQHFGTAIQCMVPAHFPGTWVNYVQDYCFVSNTYTVNTSAVIAIGQEANVLKEEIVYYQWVPYVLLVQALLCYTPKFLWNIVIEHGEQSYSDLRSVLEEAIKLPGITSVSARQKHLRKVANFAVGYIRYKQRKLGYSCLSGYHCFLFYLFMKWLYFGCCLCQVLLINNFVGDGSLLWGYHFTEQVFRGNDWKVSNMFPRVTFCDVETTQVGQMNTYTMQCVLMINVLNEKLYVALWFWLMILMVIDGVNAVNSTLLLLCPYLQYTRILSLLQADHNCIDMRAKSYLLNFAVHILRPDGILLLSFVKNRMNGLYASDLTREIWLVADDDQNPYFV